MNRIQGCGLIPAKCSWGGARNRYGRSEALTLDQCRNLIAAADHAERLALPFNRHWTVHYKLAGIAEVDARRFIGRLLKLSRDYAGRHGCKFAAIWVREGGAGKGGHAHILMHLPARLSLKGRTRRWVRLAGGECRDTVSYVRAVAGRISAAESGSEHYAANAAIIRAYLLKGANPGALKALHLEGDGHGGLIVGQRCGWTQNIGASARTAVT